MNVSLALAKFYSNLDLEKQDIQLLMQKIGAQLGAIESVTDISQKYKAARIVRVVRCDKHPNADKLSICLIDDGGVTPSIERNEDQLIQVVCGAPNVTSNILVVWLPPGATVPNSVDKEPFVLDSRDIRGQISHGMLASPRELDISENHDGILIISEDIQPGELFTDALRLNDHIIDIENKMFTHRPDCFGLIGVYREIAGIQHQKFTGPDWYTNENVYELNKSTDSLALTVINELPNVVPRFMAVAMRDVHIKPSPVWLQSNLMRLGLRPINNIVDITNYMMTLTGQPLHAYDYDKVLAKCSDKKTATLKIRYPQAKEKLLLLNGKTVEPGPETIMIATDSQLIGIGGVMGGSDTEIDDHTKNIILECATFNMYSIRRTSMTHGLFTDAVSRFNKGQSPLQNKIVTLKTIHEIETLAHGMVASQLIDSNHVPDDVLKRRSLHPPVSISADFINQRLGTQFEITEITDLLKNVEFNISEKSTNTIEVLAPYWRTDIEIPEDVVEEVGRLKGYDNLPFELPKRTVLPAKPNPTLKQKQYIRQRLNQAGANEVLTYSFVHSKLMSDAGQDTKLAYQLANAISPELHYYRISLVPSLLERIHPNIKAGYDSFAIFELGKTHAVNLVLEENKLPQEAEALAFIIAKNDKAVQENEGAAFYNAKKFLDFVVGGQMKLTFEDVKDTEMEPMATPFDVKRSAWITLASGKHIGIIGEIKNLVRQKFKLPSFCAGFELDISQITLESEAVVRYQPLSKYPNIDQDICLKVSTNVSVHSVQEVIEQVLTTQIKQATYKYEVIDIYQSPQDESHKQITFRISVTSYEKTMTETEMSHLLDAVALQCHNDLQAERI